MTEPNRRNAREVCRNTVPTLHAQMDSTSQSATLCPCSYTFIFITDFVHFPVEPQLFGVPAIRRRPQHSDVASAIVLNYSQRHISCDSVDKVPPDLRTAILLGHHTVEIQAKYNTCVFPRRRHPPSGNLRSVQLSQVSGKCSCVRRASSPQL